jgi:hypothetical protein
VLDDRVYFPRVRHETILNSLLSSEPNGIVPVVGVPVSESEIECDDEVVNAFGE